MAPYHVCHSIDAFTRETQGSTSLLNPATRYLPASPAPKLSSTDSATGLKRIHTIALAIASSIRKTVIEAPKSSWRQDRCDAASLYYPRNIRPTRRLTRLAHRLQSWHINCDSVDLAKG